MRGNRGTGIIVCFLFYNAAKSQKFFKKVIALDLDMW